MEIKIIYVSGPMTGQQDYNRPLFNRITERLQRAGFNVYNPAELGKSDWNWIDYMKRDLRWLLESDAILLLPGYEASKGAALEHRVAVDLGIQVLHMELFLAHLEKLDSGDP